MNLRCRAFSLVEVLIAAGILSVGLGAAAVLAASLMNQQQRNAIAQRAFNLQEQASKLYRLDMPRATILDILPELCTGSGAPLAGGYVLTFTPATDANFNFTVSGTTVTTKRRDLRIVYADPAGTGDFRTNTISIVRPRTRVEYPQ